MVLASAVSTIESMPGVPLMFAAIAVSSGWGGQRVSRPPMTSSTAIASGAAMARTHQSASTTQSHRLMRPPPAVHRCGRSGSYRITDAADTINAAAVRNTSARITSAMTTTRTVTHPDPGPARGGAGVHRSSEWAEVVSHCSPPPNYELALSLLRRANCKFDAAGTGYA